MFHALDLTVKILHFAILSVLQNKPFRSAISNAVFRRLFCKICKRLALHIVAKKWLKRNYNMSSREKKSWEWGRKQRESGRALRGSSVAQGDPLPVTGIAAGRKRYGGRGCRALRARRERYGGRGSWSVYERCRGIEERWRWHKGAVSRSVWGAGVGAYAGGIGERIECGGFYSHTIISVK